MEKKKVNVSLTTFAVTILFLIAIIAIIVMGMMMNKLSSEKEIAEIKVSELESALNSMESTVNNLQGKLDTISNTLNYDNANQSSNDQTLESTETKKTDEEIVKELFIGQIKEWDSENSEKLLDYRVDNVKIVTGNEKKSLTDEFYPNAKESDMFANVTYSVKPSNVNNSSWIAGNGEIEGNWIVEKSQCVYIVSDNGEYKIESSGTGW